MALLYPDCTETPSCLRLFINIKTSSGRRATSGQHRRWKRTRAAGFKWELGTLERVPWVRINTSTRTTTTTKKLNRGVFHLEHNTIEQRGQVRQYNSNRNGLGPKRGREQLFWPFEHLRRWQTAESALSPVVAGHTSSLHSGFLHYSSVLSRVKLCCLEGTRTWTHALWHVVQNSYGAKHDRLFLWQCSISKSVYFMQLVSSLLRLQEHCVHVW